MKVPQNFNAGATKKVNPVEAAIAGNFSRTQQAESGQVSQSQIFNAPEPAATTAPLTTQSERMIVEQIRPAEKPAEEPKSATRREVKEKFLVSMSKGERSVFKSFCALQGVSMNHFVMCAMDYFKEDLENGKVSLSSHSYKRKEV